MFIRDIGGLPAAGGLDDAIGSLGSFLQRPKSDGTVLPVYNLGGNAVLCSGT